MMCAVKTGDSPAWKGESNQEASSASAAVVLGDGLLLPV